MHVIKKLYNLRQLDTPIKIKTANGTIESNTVGCANIVNENGELAVILNNVIYVPTFGVNLISSRKFTSKGCTITENKNEAVIYRPNNGGILLKAITNNNLYRVQAYYDDIVSDENINNNNKNNNDKINNSEKEVIQKLQQLHILYGHLSYTTLYQLIKNKCIDDINIDKSIINDKIIKTLQQQECKACIKGKFKRLPMTSKIEYNVNDKMDMWVADLMGPVRVETIGDIQYILVVCDVHEKYIFMKGVKDKTEATTALINIIKQQQIQTGKKLKTLHTDNGGEFISGTLTEYLADNGTTITYTTPHTPQHNAIAERMIQTIMNTTRCMMIQAQAPACMWALAVKCAAYILNRRMSTVNNNKTISESWHDKKVKINNMHTWGCDAYYYKHKVERDSKVDDRAEEGIFVGYDIDNDSYYYIYNTNTDKIIKTRDVRMYDNKFNNMKKLYDSENDNNNSNSDGSDIVSAGDDYIDERYSTTQIEEMLKQLEQSIHNKINNNNNNETKNNNKDSKDEVQDSTSSNVKDNNNINTNNNNNNNININNNNNNNDNNTISNINNNNNNNTNKTANTNKRTSILSAEQKDQINKQTAEIMQRRASISSSSSSSTSSSNVIKTNTNTKPTINKNINTTTIPTTRSGRITAKPNTYSGSDYDKKTQTFYTCSDDINDNEYALLTYTDEPTTYEQAVTNTEATEWKKAIQEELTAHSKNNTWSVVEQDNNMNIITVKWVFKKKKDASGNVCRYKARLVARGFSQVYGVDYDATYAPVLKYKSLRLILILSTIYNNNIEQLDIKTAFLNATVKENIYIQPPEGVTTTTKQVLKLNKALYGIKQAPREWNENINKYLLSIKFKRCIKESCIYIKLSNNNNRIIIGLFVDDILVSYNKQDIQEWKQYKQHMKQQYELSEMGEAQHILGMRITRRNDNKQLFIDQQVYIQDKLLQFNMSECKGVSSPEANNIKLTECVNEDELLSEQNTYRAIVGSLIYASISTRPDITHAVNMTSRYMHAPGNMHMTAVKRILRYLSTTKHYCIKYENKNDNNNDDNTKLTITGYCDADWGGSEDRKSTTGYCTFINNNIISWNTKKQQTVALSTAEAEYMAITEVVQEVQWIKQLLEEMKYNINTPINIYVDNMSAISIGENDVQHDRTKHIDIKYHYIRECK